MRDLTMLLIKSPRLVPCLAVLAAVMLWGCDNGVDRDAAQDPAARPADPSAVARPAAEPLPPVGSAARLDPRSRNADAPPDTAEPDIATRTSPTEADDTGALSSTQTAETQALTGSAEVPASMIEREPVGTAEVEAEVPEGRPMFSSPDADPLPDGSTIAKALDEEETPSPQVAAAMPDSESDGTGDEPPAATVEQPAVSTATVAVISVPLRLQDHSGRSPFPADGEFITKPRPTRKVGEAERPEPGPLKVIKWNDANNHIGETVIVEGKIVDTYNHNNSIVFLNFDADWDGKFYIPVFDDAFPGIPGPPETFYKNKTLRVTGKITMHRGRPNIEVKDPAQIEVVK